MLPLPDLVGHWPAVLMSPGVDKDGPQIHTHLHADPGRLFNLIPYVYRLETEADFFLSCSVNLKLILFAL